MRRWVADSLMLVAVVFLPWWAAIAFGLWCAWQFEPYYEGLVVGLAFDSLYGVSLDRFHRVALVYTFAAVIIMVAASFLKKRLSL